jgi:hypothetical protein
MPPARQDQRRATTRAAVGSEMIEGWVNFRTLPVVIKLLMIDAVLTTDHAPSWFVAPYGAGWIPRTDPCLSAALNRCTRSNEKHAG